MMKRLMPSADKTRHGVTRNKELTARRLAGARRVVLVGLGNIGTRLAMELPLVGAKEVLLVDPDTISQRNLRTCWAFRPDVIGRAKVDVIGEQVRQSFAKVSVEVAPCSFNRLGLACLRDWSPAVLVGAVDSRRARYELAEAALWLGMPLVDLGIPAAGPPAARVQVTWRAIRAIDPLNAWSTHDWHLLEQAHPCGTSPAGSNRRPVASSVSGAAAASLGAAALRRLFACDISDIGWEARVELVRFSTARRPLPAKGLSPLDPSETICARPPLCHAATLGDLVGFAERQCGPGAVLLLNREISFGFRCRRCGSQSHVGTVEQQPCRMCGKPMIPVHPLTHLDRDTLNEHVNALVRCLGVERDLLRVMARTARDHVWMEYCEERNHE